MRRDMRPVIIRQATPSGEPDRQFLFTPGPTFANVQGRMVEVPPGPGFRAFASVQPVSGRVAQTLPEGSRADDWREVWVATLEDIRPSEAKQSDGSGGKRGHTLLAFGVLYEFREVRDWRADGGYIYGRVQKVVR